MGGKLVNCTTGALLTGVDIKTSIQMGFSLAQIGEFAYMVALLYVTTTGDVDKPIYQIVVGASLITTVLNPMMIRQGGNFCREKLSVENQEYFKRLSRVSREVP